MYARAPADAQNTPSTMASTVASRDATVMALTVTAPRTTRTAPIDTWTADTPSVNVVAPWRGVDHTPETCPMLPFASPTSEAALMTTKYPTRPKARRTAGVDIRIAAVPSSAAAITTGHSRASSRYRPSAASAAVATKAPDNQRSTLWDP